MFGKKGMTSGKRPRNLRTKTLTAKQSKGIRGGIALLPAVQKGGDGQTGFGGN